MRYATLCRSKNVAAFCMSSYGCKSLRDTFGHPMAQSFCRLLQNLFVAPVGILLPNGRSSHQSGGLPHAKGLSESLGGGFTAKNFHDDGIENLNDRCSRCHFDAIRIEQVESVRFRIAMIHFGCREYTLQIPQNKGCLKSGFTRRRKRGHSTLIYKWVRLR